MALSDCALMTMGSTTSQTKTVSRFPSSSPGGRLVENSFNTHNSHYEYLVMLFRLTNIHTVFQGLVNDILHDIVSCFVSIHYNNILLFSKTLEEHIMHVRKVIHRHSLVLCPVPRVHHVKGAHVDGPSQGACHPGVATPADYKQ